jgi:hypothetical protein
VIRLTVGGEVFIENIDETALRKAISPLQIVVECDTEDEATLVNRSIHEWAPIVACKERVN